MDALAEGLVGVVFLEGGDALTEGKTGNVCGAVLSTVFRTRESFLCTLVREIALRSLGGKTVLDSSLLSFSSSPSGLPFDGRDDVWSGSALP